MISVIFKSKMSIIKTIAGINIRSLISGLITLLLLNCIACHGDRPAWKRGLVSSGISDSTKVSGTPDEYLSVNAMLVLPKNPASGGNIPHFGDRRGKYPESKDHCKRSVG